MNSTRSRPSRKTGPVVPGVSPVSSRAIPVSKGTWVPDLERYQHEIAEEQNVLRWPRERREMVRLPALTPGCVLGDVLAPGIRVGDVHVDLDGHERMITGRRVPKSRQLRKRQALRRSDEVLTKMADEDFWRSRKDLSLIREWARARRAGPWAVLGEVLANVTCRTPPSLVLPPIVGGQGTLNMLIAVTGRSGAGKGSAAAVARDAVEFQKTLLLKPKRTPLGSGEGLSKTFGYMRKNPDTGASELVITDHTAIITITEIDTFEALKSRNGATLSPELRKLYSGEDLGFGYADLSKRVVIPAHSYRACVIAGVQPGRGEVILGDTDGGFAQRWLWLPASDPSAPDIAPAVPARLSWHMPYGFGALDPESEPVQMEVCQRAISEIDNARLGTLRGDGEELLAHSYYTRLKVAASLALLGMREDITEKDWDASGFIMQVSDATRDATARLLRDKAAAENRARGRAEGIRSVVARDTADKARLRRISSNVLKHVPARGWISERELSKKIALHDRELLPDVLQELLVSSGAIESREEDWKGGRRVLYRRVRGDAG